MGSPLSYGCRMGGFCVNIYNAITECTITLAHTAPPAHRRLPHKEMALACDCKAGFFDKYKECKLQEYKCKECLICNECDSLFKPDEQFLKEQKRKIKDG